MEERLKSFYGKDKLTEGITNDWFDMKVLLDALAAHTEPDMGTYPCSMAIDMIEAYYKVASSPLPCQDSNPANPKQDRMKTLVDDGNILAIESCLLQKLSCVLFPVIRNSNKGRVPRL